MRCLIIDDDDSVLALMRRIVGNLGHRVTVAANGKRAMVAVASEAFDIAIVDLEMPGMNGPDTIAALRRVAPDLRVLVVSGYDDKRHVIQALNAGADGYLLKDEIGDLLGRSLQDVFAGHTPLSSRVASVVLRSMRRPSATPVTSLRDPPRRIADGTDEVAALRDDPTRAPTSDAEPETGPDFDD